MGQKQAAHILAVFVAIVLAVALNACSEDEGTNGPTLSLNNCSSCHSDAARLIATADPEDPGSEPEPGEG
jgi:hypothetical protein